MGKLVPSLVVFFLAMNLIAGVAVNQGVDHALGIETNVGGDEIADQTNSDVPTGSPTGQTLFGLYNVVGGFLGGIYETLMPGLVMLERAGTPHFITQGILAPIFSLLTAFSIASFVRGWDL